MIVWHSWLLLINHKKRCFMKLIQWLFILILIYSCSNKHKYEDVAWKIQEYYNPVGSYVTTFTVDKLKENKTVYIHVGVVSSVMNL